MPRQWKKADCRKAIEDCARTISARFGLDEHPIEEYGSGRDWEYFAPSLGDRFTVWTRHGAARVSVSINARFAHLAFRFDDVERAKAELTAWRDDLNPWSGKWNTHLTPAMGSPPDFVADLTHRLRHVAAINPEALAAWKAEEAKRSAAWREAMVETLAKAP